MSYDLLIKDAQICDGTGAPLFHGSVGVSDGQMNQRERSMGDEESKSGGSTSARSARRSKSSSGCRRRAVVIRAFVMANSDCDRIPPYNFRIRLQIPIAAVTMTPSDELSFT